jgi:hypothetical protein
VRIWLFAQFVGSIHSVYIYANIVPLNIECIRYGRAVMVVGLHFFLFEKTYLCFWYLLI